jgi:hypothetical protein
MENEVNDKAEGRWNARPNKASFSLTGLRVIIRNAVKNTIEG